MGVLDWIFERGIRTWEEPTNPLTKLTMDDLYKLDVSGIADLSRSEAMQIDAVAKIRNRAAAKIGGFPMVAMKGTGTYSDAPAWIGNLETGQSRFVSVSWIVEALMFYGRAFMLIEKRTSRSINSFRFVPEWHAVTKHGKLLQAFGKDVKPDDYIRIDAHHEGLLNYGQDILKRAALIEKAAAKAGENPVPSIELHQTGGAAMNDTEIDKLIARWAAARTGKNGGVAYTSQSIETKTHGQPAEQLLIDGRNMAAIAISRAMGAPAWMIDAAVSGSSITYGNVNGRSRELVEDLLQPYMDAISGRLSLDDILPRGVWLKFDASSVLRDDFKTRMEGYKAAQEAGIYTAEQCKMLEAGVPLEQSEV